MIWKKSFQLICSFFTPNCVSDQTCHWLLLPSHLWVLPWLGNGLGSDELQNLWSGLHFHRGGSKPQPWTFHLPKRRCCHRKMPHRWTFPQSWCWKAQIDNKKFSELTPSEINLLDQMEFYLEYTWRELMRWPLSRCQRVCKTQQCNGFQRVTTVRSLLFPWYWSHMLIYKKVCRGKNGRCNSLPEYILSTYSVFI